MNSCTLEFNGNPVIDKEKFKSLNLDLFGLGCHFIKKDLSCESDANGAPRDTGLLPFAFRLLANIFSETDDRNL